MNFEFKSTFKTTNLTKIKKRFRKTGRRFLTDNAVVLLIVNISALTLIVYFYLQNEFIPAVYGSKPTASFWINLFIALAIIWTTTTLYAGLRILMKITLTRNAILNGPEFLRSVTIHAVMIGAFIILQILLMIAPILQMNNEKRQLQKP